MSTEIPIKGVLPSNVNKYLDADNDGIIEHSELGSNQSQMTLVDEHVERSLEKVKLILLDDDIKLMDEFTSSACIYIEVQH